jgi:hypothetical protein
LRAHVGEYLKRRGAAAGAHERGTLARLVSCGTPALGGHAWQCAHCATWRVDYNSCRDRFCPSCGGAKRAAWFDRLASSLLPVPHFHLVFTVPHELSEIILANRRELYGLLFRAAWETLRDVALDPQHLGGEVGAVLVLHTWGQALDHHPHVHAIVPGGGLSLDGTRWIEPRSPKFFLPVKVLSRVFRGKFLEGLRRLHDAERCPAPPATTDDEDSSARFAALLRALYAREWVVFSEAPPPAIAADDPAPLVKYLARYVSGAAISDGRLIEHASGHVTFWAKNYRQGRQWTTLRLSGVEFTRRFALHILPSGLARVRRYGLMAPRHLAARQARALLPRPRPPELPARSLGETDDSQSEPSRCPRCEIGQLVLIRTLPRPSRRQVLANCGFPPAPQPAGLDTS